MSPEAQRAQALLEHAAWIRALAAALVRDPDRAEDVAQETLVAAWEHGPLESSGIRAWLTSVARNFARMDLRSSSRRSTHEAAAARPEALPPTHAVVERAHLQHELVEAVLQLDEPYRSALLLRFYEGKPPRAIARELRLPIATVRSHLARGLAQLRARLDRSHGERANWALVLVPLVRPSALPTVPLAGALLMNAKLQIAAALTVAAGTVWILAQSGQPAPPPERGLVNTEQEPRGAPLEDVQLQNEVGERAAAVSSGAASGADAHSVSAAAPSTTQVRGRVLGVDTHGVSDVPLVLREQAPGSEPWGALLPAAALGTASGPDGSFEFDARGRTGRIYADDPRFETVYAGSLERTTHDVQLVVARRGSAAGVVLDQAGRTLAGAVLRFWPAVEVRTRFATALDQASDVDRRARSDEQGRFRVESLPVFDGMRVRCELDGYQEWTARLTDVLSDSMTIVLTRVGSAERALRGRVVDAQGTAVEGALVALDTTTTTSDERGGFVLALAERRGADAQPTVLRAVKAGHLPGELRAEQRPDGAHWPDFVQIELGGAPLSIAGRVVGTDGQAFTGAKVWVADTTTLGYAGDELMQVESVLGGGSKAWHSVASDAQGRFVIEGLLDRAYTVVALDPRTLLRVVAREVPAGSARLELAFPADAVFPRLAGRVVDSKGQGVAGVQLRIVADVFVAHSEGLRLMSHNFPREGPLTDAEGRFALEDVPRTGAALRFTSDEILPLEIGAGDFTPEGTSTASLEEFAGGHPEELRVEVERRAHLQVEVVDRTGKPEFFLLDTDGKRVEMTVFMGTTRYLPQFVQCGEGKSQVVATSARARWLVLRRNGKETQRVSVELVPGEITRLKL